MSGPFGSSQWMYNAGGAFYDYEIDGSLRFNTVDSPRLTRSVTHDRKTFTISFWTKRCNVIRLMLYGTYSSGSDTAVLGFETDGTLTFYDYLSGYRTQVRTNQVFRDNTAWYHIVVAVDTTQATASDRVKMYVNGEQVTSFQTATYPSQNLDLKFGAGGTHAIGTEGTNSRLWYDGYLANWALVAGQQLDPTSFGEFKSGIWKPIDITGLTYGTGGYLLEFDGNANDTSGNGNNWTENNISSYDYVLDSPTNNFPTMTYEALTGAGYTQHRQGNLQLYQPSWGGWDVRLTNCNMPASGKYYWEVCPVQGSFGAGSGGFTLQFDNIRGNENMSGFPNFGAPMAYFYGGGLGEYRVNPSWVNYTKSGTFSYTVGSTVMQVAVDCDNNKIWYGINNSWMGVSGTTVTAGTGDPANGTNGQAISGDVTDYAFAAQCADQSAACRLGINFGQDSTFAGTLTAGGNTDENGYGDFQYAPPSGFVCLSSQGMPAPAIDPAADATPEDYFNTVLYSGNGTSQSITGVGFSPDALWIKERSSTSQHQLFHDIDGGTPKFLQPSTNIAEVTDAQVVSSFDADGFSVGNSGGSNQSGQTYVAWNWYTGATPTSNTDGSITSTVSANPDAGFSVVTYTRTTSGSDTIGHGLSSAPEIIIYKSRASAADWYVTHTLVDGSYDFLRLNQDYANANVSGASAPTSTVFSNTIYGSAENFVAYCFHSVDGYLKCGKYTGNGSSDGSFIYTGFRPAFLIVKRTDTAQPWYVVDNKRDVDNPTDVLVLANSSGSESSYGTSRSDFDFLSNGFKNRNTFSGNNASGGSYIYLAFAEQPFKYANAR